ncbi:unnamed protein product [Caenorhabditis sp. 36 PRJEB53466]|nr:unnamed protein product [Caenorhabditis sp. 36 PRJEB53466]
MVYGFAVGVRQKSFDLYSPEERGIVFGANNINAELGKWYQKSINTFVPMDTPHKEVLITVDEGDGSLIIYTMVLKPDLSEFDARVQQKHAGSVWAPYLGWIADHDKICENFAIERMFAVNVKFLLGSSVPHFKVVGILAFATECFFINEEEVAKKWEHECKRIRTEGPLIGRPTSSIQNVYWPIRKTVTALMIGTVAVRGNVFSKYMYTHQLGILREVYGYQPEATVIGKWYEVSTKWYRIVETKQKRANFYTLRATKPKLIHELLPTRVVNGQLEITLKFQLERGLFEPCSNSKIADWSVRSGQVYKNIVLENEHLNLISVPTPVAVHILQKIQKMFETEENIEIKVGVMLKTDYLRRYQGREKEAIFEVRKVKSISQKRKGEAGKMVWNSDTFLADVMKPFLGNFDEKIRKKYEDFVWSPTIGWLQNDLQLEAFHSPQTMVVKQLPDAKQSYKMCRPLSTDPSAPLLMSSVSFGTEWMKAKLALGMEEMMVKHSTCMFLELHQKPNAVYHHGRFEGICIKRIDTPFYFYSPQLGLIVLDEEERQTRNIAHPIIGAWYDITVKDRRDGKYESNEWFRAIHEQRCEGFPNAHLPGNGIQLNLTIEIDERCWKELKEKSLMYSPLVNLVQVDRENVMKLISALDMKYGRRERALEAVRKDHLLVSVVVELRIDFVEAFHENCYAPLFEVVKLKSDLKHKTSGRMVPFEYIDLDNVNT